MLDIKKTCARSIICMNILTKQVKHNTRHIVYIQSAREVSRARLTGRRTGGGPGTGIEVSERSLVKENCSVSEHSVVLGCSGLLEISGVSMAVMIGATWMM